MRFLALISVLAKSHLDERIDKMTINEALQAVKKMPPELQMLQQQLQGKGEKVVAGEDNQLKRATEILNGMIAATEEELTMEIETYTEITTKQLEELNTSRLDRDSATKQAASAISWLQYYEGMEAEQTNILETVQAKLGEKHKYCDMEKYMTNEQIKLLESDSSVIGAIMEMVNCKKTMLLQCIFMQKGGSEKQYFGIHDKAVAKKVAALKTPIARAAVQRAVGQTLGTAPASLFQKSTRRHHKHKHLVVHGDPEDFVASPPTNTTDSSMARSGADQRVPPAGEPLDSGKQGKKCSIDKSPQCPKFTDAMMEMQGEVMSELVQLRRYLAQVEGECETDIRTFELQVNNANELITEAGAGIGTNTKIKTESLNTARTLTQEILALEHTMKMEMIEHNKKVSEFHETICGVKVIRKEMYKLKGVEMLIQDCELTEWQEGECNATCAGGKREFTREVIQAAKFGGEKCGAMVKYEACNVQPCPIDCVLGEWQGWSECSAVGGCGGGVMTRNRQKMQDAEHGGAMCEVTNESEMCAMQSCDEDCELSSWSDWSGCSKACDTGFQRRKKKILKPKKGNGWCPKWRKRHQFKRCNTQPCREDIQCDSEVDVVVMLDSSGSLGEEAFHQVRHFGANLIRRLNRPPSADEGAETAAPAKAQVSVVLFSGPGTWDDWYACDDPNVETTDEQCGLKKVSGLSGDTEALATEVESLPWLEMTTNTAGALAMAQAALDDGRPEAASIVFVVTDGNPNFPEKTYNAAKKLRETARLIFVPIGPYVNLEDMKHWASRPLRENLIPISSSWDLEWLVPKFIADLCPVVYSHEKELESVTTQTLDDGPTDSVGGATAVI